jgi:hypothetical protein
VLHQPEQLFDLFLVQSAHVPLECAGERGTRPFRSS